MQKSRRGAAILSLVISVILSLVATSCCLFQTQPGIVLDESKVQKMLKGDSANFDGYLLTTSAVAKLLETAEASKK